MAAPGLCSVISRLPTVWLLENQLNETGVAPRADNYHRETNGNCTKYSWQGEHGFLHRYITLVVQSPRDRRYCCYSDKNIYRYKCWCAHKLRVLNIIQITNGI